MWISRQEWHELKKKITELEEQVQIQQRVMSLHIKNHEKENKELKEILSSIKVGIYSGLTQIS